MVSPKVAFTRHLFNRLYLFSTAQMSVIRCWRFVKHRGTQLISCVVSLFLTACSPPAASDSAPPILLFYGNGTSANDVAAVEKILKNNHLKYSTVNSRQLNG